MMAPRGGRMLLIVANALIIVNYWLDFIADTAPGVAFFSGLEKARLGEIEIRFVRNLTKEIRIRSACGCNHFIRHGRVWVALYVFH